MKIVEVAEQLKASVSLAKELKETCQDLIKRDDLSEELLFKEIEMEDILADSDKTRTQKIEAIRWRLHKLRYPKLAETEVQFNRAKKALRLPESIRLNHAPFFEKREIRIEIKSRSLSELKEQVAKLNEALQQPEVKDLFV